MRKEITSEAELDSFISQVSNEAPLPVKCMLNGQLQIIRTLKNPTLIDYSISEIIEGLNSSLSECSNDNEKKLVRRQFSSMITNLVFFLDAELHKTIQDNDQLAKMTFLRAGDLFMDNMRDVMVSSINTFGAAGKIVATSADHIGKDVIITLSGVTTQVVNTVGASSFDVTESTTNQGDSSTQSTTFHKDPMSDEALHVNKEILFEVIDKIDQHRGEASREVNEHIDKWVDSISNVIIYDLFSDERKEKTLSLFDSTMQLLSKNKTEQKAMNDFIRSVSYTICKLGKYRELIGPSIRISDMIERYVRVFREAHVVTPDKKENFFTKHLPKSIKSLSFGATTLFAATQFVCPYISIPIMVGSVIAGSSIGDKKNITVTIDMALDEYQKIADSYNPYNTQQ